MVSVAVIGAGIIGAAVADRLAAAGAAVTIVDAAVPGSGTSGTSFAWLNSNAKLPRHYHDLSVRALREWARLAAGFGQPPWYVPTGNVMWAEADGPRAELTERVQRLRAWDYPAEELSARQLADLEPSLRVPPTARIAYFPGEGFVHGEPAVQALLDRARSAGAQLRSPVGDVMLDAGDARIDRVRLPDGGAVQADVYVCCAGWRTAHVLRPLGMAVPLVEGDTPGSAAPCLVVTANGPTPLRRVVHTPRVNLRPAWQGGVRLESGELNDLVDTHTPADELDGYGRQLLSRAAEVLPGFTPGTSQNRLCVRPLPLDGHPLVGWLPPLANLYLAVMHSGITLAPELSRLIAADILGRGAEELEPYRPTR
jgi:glycine/D-amino acid oxidase-like deaminating enzyme